MPFSITDLKKKKFFSFLGIEKYEILRVLWTQFFFLNGGFEALTKVLKMPTIRRTIKNVVWNYSDAQIKVREATSNDPWGPSSTLMSEIADLTYNVVAFTEIMQMIWKRLNDHGKNWRHVYKSLVLLDYIIKTGSEKVAQQCKENIYAIQTLKDFQYTEDNKDQGMNVREKAKQLVSLLKDDERLRNERAKALKAKERFAQNAMGIGSNNKVNPPLFFFYYYSSKTILEFRL